MRGVLAAGWGGLPLVGPLITDAVPWQAAVGVAAGGMALLTARHLVGLVLDYRLRCRLIDKVGAGASLADAAPALTAVRSESS
jgi:hypothetical protein